MTPTCRCLGLLSLALWLALSGASHARGIADQVRSWFETEYVPLWKDLSAADPSRIREFWAEDFRDHPIDMDSSLWENSEERWQRNLERYRSDGLKGSEVVGIEAEEISERAVLIRTVWRDYGPDCELEEPYCGTFIVGKFESGWKFTNYFTVECAPE